MIILFLVSLFATFLIVRISAHLLHDVKNYGTRKDKSKTFTAILRKLMKRDIHHIHLGFIILSIVLLLILSYGLTSVLIILLAVSLSLIADQILPLLGCGNYFSKKMIITSLILHLIISLISLFLI